MLGGVGEGDGGDGEALAPAPALARLLANTSAFRSSGFVLPHHMDFLLSPHLFHNDPLQRATIEASYLYRCPDHLDTRCSPISRWQVAGGRWQVEGGRWKV